MLHLAVLSLALVASLAQAEVTVKDCHPTGDSAVKLSNAALNPHPVKLPGMVNVKADVELVRPLDNFDVNVTLIKDVLGFPVKIPCLDNIGSCVYEDGCAILNEIFPPGEPCPGKLTQCRCPFKPNTLEIDRDLDLPQIPPELSPVVGGKYEVFLSLQDMATKEVLSCLNVKFEVESN